MRRRDFIKVIAGSSVVWPLTSAAQHRTAPLVGVLSSATAEADANRMNAIGEGLKEIGYVVRESAMIEYRSAEYQLDRLPALAAELVGRQVDVIVTVATPATLAAKAATNTIPIVFSVGADPVQLGLVASLNRPDTNITGVFSSAVAITGKRLELLHELFPSAGIITFLVNPKNAPVADVETQVLRGAAHTLAVELRILNASNSNEIDAAFATLSKDRPVPLLVSADALFTNQRVQLIVLTARYVIPAIYAYRELAVAGGLMSYGSNLAYEYRRVGVYAGKILRGTKPSDLPAQQAVKFEFVINLQTARALGIEVPPAVLSIADEVIE